ncbi:hypothetical protein ACOSP7_003479 [Xanthoceras sorbifolium]
MALAQRNFQAMEVGSSIKPERKFRVTKKKQARLSYRQHNLARSHTVFKYLIPVLIALLQVDYQSKPLSPFDTHPVNMWVFFVATCCYYLGFYIEKELQIHWPHYSQCISGVILSSGALSSISLASIFLPRPLGWLCLSLWTVLPIVLGRHFIKQIYQWLKHGIKQKSSKAHDKFKTWWGSLHWKNQHLPQ